MHESVEQGKIDDRHATRGERETAVAHAESKSKHPVEQQIQTDRGEAHQHWRGPAVYRVKRWSKHFDPRIRSQAHRVKTQSRGRLQRRFSIKATVLKDHRNNRIREKNESKGGRDCE